MRKSTASMVFGSVMLAFAAFPAHATAPVLTALYANELDVTSGGITTLGSGLLRTADPKMRAYERPFSTTRHARAAKLRFRYLGPSVADEPLQSGAFRRQAGIKLLARDGCNVVYVMWRFAPTNSVVVSIKRNLSMTESSQCGNNGYTDVVSIPVSSSTHPINMGTHSLEARLGTPTATAVPLQLLINSQVIWSGTILKSRLGFDGPAGMRTDNGTFNLEVSTGDYRTLR
jgi:hypothetical protein